MALTHYSDSAVFHLRKPICGADPKVENAATPLVFWREAKEYRCPECLKVLRARREAQKSNPETK